MEMTRIKPDIKDINLAPEGEKKIKWVQRHMPVLESIKKEFEETKPLVEVMGLYPEDLKNFLMFQE